MSEPLLQHQLMMVDRGLGVYKRRTTIRFVYGQGYPGIKNQTDYLLVQGPVFLPDTVDGQKIISCHRTQADAVTALQRFVLTQLSGGSTKASEKPAPPLGKEIGGHQASSMQRGSGLLYPVKTQEGFDPKDYNGVIVTAETGQAYWASVWHRQVNGRPVLELRLSPKGSQPTS
jgi:hypothetical protein